MTKRDWIWTVSILTGIIIYLLTYDLWGKSGDITNVVSIGSGLVSIALALVAIIYAFLEGKKSEIKEVKVNSALDSIIANFNTMKDVINKLDSHVIKTHNKVTKIGKQIDQYKMFYSGQQETIESDETEPNSNEKQEQNEKPSDNKKPNQNNKTSENKKPSENNQPTTQKENPILSYTQLNGVTRGDVFFADTSPVVGSEMGGLRPVLVIQNEIGNKFSPTITIAPITARIQKAKLPTHVEISAERYPFAKDSVILLEQIRTIDKARLQEKITHLNKDIMDEVDDSLMIQLGLIDF